MSDPFGELAAQGERTAEAEQAEAARVARRQAGRDRMIAARARREARSLEIDAARAAHLKLVDAELLDLREEWRGLLEAGTPLPPRHVMGTALIGTHLWDLAQRFPRDVSRPSAHYRVRYHDAVTGQNRPKTTAEIVAESLAGPTPVVDVQPAAEPPMAARDGQPEASPAVPEDDEPVSKFYTVLAAFTNQGRSMNPAT